MNDIFAIGLVCINRWEAKQRNSSVKGGATPALNALATLLVLASFFVLIIGLFGLSAWRKQQGERGGLRAALADVTQMDN